MTDLTKLNPGARQMGLAELKVMPRDTPAAVTLTGEFIISGSGLPVFLPEGSDGQTIPLACLSKEYAPTARVELLTPPVDPDLLLAREVAAKRLRNKGLTMAAKLSLSGAQDEEIAIVLILAGIKAAKAGGKA